MKKVIMLAALICASFFVLNSCDSDSNGSGSVDNSIKDGAKLKITYVVDSAYFTLPEDAPKYHIYGTDTELPVPVEKNGLPNLMKAKFWSDGTRDGITVLGARNYTKEIHVEYKYSFDTEKCNDGYIMINGACVAAPNGGKIGEACTTVGEVDIIDNGRIECGTDRKWQFTGCNDGYNYVNGKCEKANPQCEDGYVLNSKGECVEYCDSTNSANNYFNYKTGEYVGCDNGVTIRGKCGAGTYYNFYPDLGPTGCIEVVGETCDEASYGPWCSQGMFISCRNGILVAEDCGDGERCEHDRGCVDR